MWDCEHCATVNRNQWRKHLADFDRSHHCLWTFITLTTSPESHRDQTTLDNARKAWNTCYQALYRFNGRKAFHYVRVFEQHKDGAIHIHALVDLRMDDENKVSNTGLVYAPKFTRYLKDLGADKWGAYIAHGVNIMGDSGHVVLYITKYMTKQAQSFIASKGLRRIQCSQSLSMAKYTPSETWLLSGRLTLRDFYENDIYDVNLKRRLTEQDFDDGLYPKDEDYEKP
jgi:hypothetical protein